MNIARFTKCVFVLLFISITAGCKSNITKQQRIDSRKSFAKISEATAFVIREKLKFENNFKDANQKVLNAAKKKQIQAEANKHFAGAENELKKARELRTEARSALEFGENIDTKDFASIIEEVGHCTRRASELAKIPSLLYKPVSIIKNGKITN